MSFFAIYETVTGRLESLGSVVADPLPPQFTSVDIVNPPADNEMWDEAARKFISRPLKVLVDRFDDLLADAGFSLVWGSINLTQQQQIKDAIVLILGTERWRNVNSSTSIGMK